MNDTKLIQLVSAAVALDREITEKEAQLKLLKAELSLEAKSRKEQAVATEGGGTSITFEGADGCIARITKAGRTLKATISGEGEEIVAVKETAGRHFARLFTPVLVYKPVDKFREEATSELGEKDGAKLIKLCTNAGKSTVSFETKAA